jgi:hypothetical protein
MLQQAARSFACLGQRVRTRARVKRIQVMDELTLMLVMCAVAAASGRRGKPSGEAIRVRPLLPPLLHRTTFDSQHGVRLIVAASTSAHSCASLGVHIAHP